MARQGMGFFARVYTVVRRIPRGRVATYGQVAAIVESPHAARTVGWALSGVGEHEDVPWQRVVNARGEISLGRDPSGDSVQRALLEQEGIVFDRHGRIDLDRYQWEGPELHEIEAMREAWNETSQRATHAGTQSPWRDSNPRHMV